MRAITTLKPSPKPFDRGNATPCDEKPELTKEDGRAIIERVGGRVRLSAGVLPSRLFHAGGGGRPMNTLAIAVECRTKTGVESSHSPEREMETIAANIPKWSDAEVF